MCLRVELIAWTRTKCDDYIKEAETNGFSDYEVHKKYGAITTVILIREREALGQQNSLSLLNKGNLFNTCNDKNKLQDVN